MTFLNTINYTLFSGIQKSEVMSLSPRTGRPKSEKPKSTQLAVRLDNETLDKLDAVAKENSETRVETIRRGINKLYSELKK